MGYRPRTQISFDEYYHHIEQLYRFLQENYDPIERQKLIKKIVEDRVLLCHKYGGHRFGDLHVNMKVCQRCGATHVYYQTNHSVILLPQSHIDFITKNQDHLLEDAHQYEKILKSSVSWN